MAEGATTLKGLRAQIAAAAQAQAEERRSLAGNSPGPATNTSAKPQGCKPVIDGATLRVDDRLRVAKERRDEAEKQQALRETQIMERERKAKLQVERQMEERQKKVEEQRKKEEQKRLAVEEKRKQKQEKEKEHYEAVMKRTLERSQRVEQRQKRWSWGGLSQDQDGRSGDSDASVTSPVTIVISSASPEKPRGSGQVEKLSSSTTNLKQPPEAGISKRLSSSVTLVKTPDKKYHLCPRSASASPLHPPRGPVRSRSIDRQKSGMTTSVSADGALGPSLKERQLTSPVGKRPASPSSSSLGRNRSPSPAPNPAPKRTPSPVAAKQSPRMRPPSPGSLKQRPPSPQTPSAKPPPIQKPAITPTGPPTLRKRDSKSKDVCPVSAPQSSDGSKTKEKEDPKATTGTNSAAEAAKILAENRRLMREQKEREEQLRIQREEEERVRKEEEARLAEEARLKRLEEEKKLAEERKIKEEEDAILAEEERKKLAEEEAQKQIELQKEREEAEARALEEAERVRQERDRIMQQNQQERMERKKRIEEIMKRTRKGDQNELKRDDDDDEDDDDGKSLLENGDDEDDQMNYETKSDTEDFDKDDLSPGESESPEGLLSTINGKSETENKENNNGTSTDDTQAVSPVPRGCLVEGSEFLNEEDSSKVGLVSSLNGKSNQWSFEELIDVNVHSKTRPLIETEDCNQVLINCEVSSAEPTASGDKGTPIGTLQSSNQPIEAMSEM
ncbi:MAP7 domain-containing protein 2 isoform X11 [Cololabis saira]|uniref:MAP7 domain-containing protein 2 isoform X11 n=1 Tax=Cololabis saira TaxID=129043 RepID=UPI002AD3A822|nr:MAP7 domain-containing protein 2 isoform X11 [Cololabis saira]